MITSRANPESPRTTIWTFGIRRRIAVTIFLSASTVPVLASLSLERNCAHNGTEPQKQ
jgi:hypothetical protein